MEKETMTSTSAADTKTAAENMSAELLMPSGRLDADNYNAEDLDGVTESLFGSGNLNYLTLQARQLDSLLAGGGFDTAIGRNAMDALAGGLASSANRTFSEIYMAPAKFSAESAGGDPSLPALSSTANFGHPSGYAAPVFPGAVAASIPAAALTHKETGSGSNEFLTDTTAGLDGVNGSDGSSGHDGNNGANGSDSGITVINDIVNQTTENINQTVNTVVNDINDTVNNILDSDTVQNITYTVTDTVNNVLGDVINNSTVQNITHTVTDTVNNVLDGITNNNTVQSVVNTATDFFTDVIENVTSNTLVQQIIDATSDVMTNVANTLSDTVNVAGEAVDSLFQEDAVQNVFHEISGIPDAASGLIDGILASPESGNDIDLLAQNDLNLPAGNVTLDPVENLVGDIDIIANLAHSEQGVEAGVDVVLLGNQITDTTVPVDAPVVGEVMDQLPDIGQGPESVINIAEDVSNLAGEATDNILTLDPEQTGGVGGMQDSISDIVDQVTETDAISVNAENILASGESVIDSIIVDSTALNTGASSSILDIATQSEALDVTVNDAINLLTPDASGADSPLVDDAPGSPDSVIETWTISPSITSDTAATFSDLVSTTTDTTATLPDPTGTVSSGLSLVSVADTHHTGILSGHHGGLF